MSHDETLAEALRQIVHDAVMRPARPHPADTGPARELARIAAHFRKRILAR
jgi:hypothetical protein